MSITTPLTQLFGIQHPILLAGMNAASGADLAAAVSNAGGLGVIGGLGYTPEQLKKILDDLKSQLRDPNLPFGVDLALPQVGGNARKTNYDYTKGKLPELIDITIKSGARLFVSAVGVPPKWAIDKLHEAGIPVMNMVGHPKHAIKALDAGVDIICGQGGEGGGHTGDISTVILIPALVDAVKGRKSPLTGKQVMVVGAGGISDGRGLAAALAMGAAGVWVGTRFVAAKEAGAPPAHQKAIINADFQDTTRTLIISGRPLRCIRNPYIDDWEQNRQDEIRELTSKGILPMQHDIEQKQAKGEATPEFMMSIRPWLSGQVAGRIKSVKSAKEIVDEMVQEAVQQIHGMNTMVHPAKL